MPITVELDIFSGRPNPVWEVSDDDLASLSLRPEALVEQAATAEVADAASGLLGYRGFRIVGDASDSVSLATAGEEAAASSLLVGNPDLERQLLKTGGAILEESLLTEVSNAIGQTPAAIAESLQAAACPPCRGATAPVYNPAWWNNNAVILRNNNCYNYANNQATNTFAQPGRGSGRIFSQLTCADVGAAAVRDGLANAPSFANPTPGWYVALVIWPGRDYHWYRQDRHGCWSHKPGQTPVRNVDNAGRTITDPRTCNRGPYTVFCTYMTTRSGVRIR
jgi:hypothetical protein